MQLRTALSFNQYVTFPWKSLEQRFFEYLSKYEKELTHFVSVSPFISMLFKYPKICWEKNVEKLWHEVGYANSNALIKMRNAAYDTDGIINS